MTSKKIQNLNLKSNKNYKLGLTVKAGAVWFPARYRLKGFAHTLFVFSLSHCWMCVVVEHVQCPVASK